MSWPPQNESRRAGKAPAAKEALHGNPSTPTAAVREEVLTAMQREAAANIATLDTSATVPDLPAEVVARRLQAEPLHQISDNTSGWPEALDLEALAEREPQPPSFIVPDWMPAGEVTLLAAHGGAGKSQVALDLAVRIALGVPWCGMVPARKRVCYVSAEDSSTILAWRLKRICAHLGVNMASLRGWLDVIDASHMDAELMSEIGRGDEPILTRLYGALRDRMEPDSVLILDGVSDLYGCSEIVRRHVRRYIRALRRLVDATGAVLLLSHIDKAIARGRETGDYYSGSTAWNNSVRARWALRDDGNGLVLSLDKANHARSGAEIRLRWDAVAHLYVADSAPADGGIVASIRDRQERDGILAAMKACCDAGIDVPAATSGQRTGYHVLRAQPAFPDALRADNKAARRKFWDLIEELRVSGAIADSLIRAKNRHPMAALILKAGAS